MTDLVFPDPNPDSQCDHSLKGGEYTVTINIDIHRGVIKYPPIWDVQCQVCGQDVSMDPGLEDLADTLYDIAPYAEGLIAEQCGIFDSLEGDR